MVGGSCRIERRCGGGPDRDSRRAWLLPIHRGFGGNRASPESSGDATEPSRAPFACISRRPRARHRDGRPRGADSVRARRSRRTASSVCARSAQIRVRRRRNWYRRLDGRALRADWRARGGELRTETERTVLAALSARIAPSVGAHSAQIGVWRRRNRYRGLVGRALRGDGALAAEKSVQRRRRSSTRRRIRSRRAARRRLAQDRVHGGEASLHSRTTRRVATRSGAR